MLQAVFASGAVPPTKMDYESDRFAQRKDWRWNSRPTMSTRHSLVWLTEVSSALC